MTSNLSARLDRLRSLKVARMVVRREPGESDMEVGLKVLAAGRPVAVMPWPCTSAKEWLQKYAPTA